MLSCLTNWLGLVEIWIILKIYFNPIWEIATVAAGAKLHIFIKIGNWDTLLQADIDVLWFTHQQARLTMIDQPYMDQVLGYANHLQFNNYFQSAFSGKNTNPSNETTLLHMLFMHKCIQWYKYKDWTNMLGQLPNNLSADSIY